MVTTESRDSLGAPTLVRLAILAGATFIYVTFGVFPLGLIADIARDLKQSEGQIGLLISGYAMITALATVPSVALVSRMSRRSALLLSMMALVIAELMTYLAHSYSMLVASRVIAGLTHGILWSLVGPAAAALVPARKVGTSTAIVFAGPVMAAIVGMPGITLIGRLVGWRSAALMLALATAVIAVGVYWAVRPPSAARGGGTASVEDEAVSKPSSTAAARWLAVSALCGLTIVLVTAEFVSFTYFALIVDHVTLSKNSTVIFLGIFGLAGALATYLVGRYSDRGPWRTAVITATVFLGAAVLLVVSQAAASTPTRCAILAAAVIGWGAAHGASGPLLQSGVIRVAGAQQDRASSVYVTCYQLGISAGAAVGALVLSRSVTLLPWTTAGLAVAVVAYATTPWARSAFSA